MMLEGFQEYIIFMLDGYEKLSGDALGNFNKVIRRQLFPKSALLLTTAAEAIDGDLLACFGPRRLTLLGTAPESPPRMVEKYIEVTDTPAELYEGLLGELRRDDIGSLRRLAANPLHCLCMCLICENGSDVTSYRTRPALLRAFFDAVQKSHCARTGLCVRSGASFPSDLKQGVSNLEEMAWRGVTGGLAAFSLDDVSSEFRNHEMFQLGLLSFHLTAKFTLNIRRMCCFSNTLFEECLLANMLARLEPADRWQRWQTLSRRPHMTSLFVSLLADADWAELSPIYDRMSSDNLAIHSRKSDNSDVTAGNVAKFNVSLMSLHDSRGRPAEAVDVVARSLPSRLYMRASRLPESETLDGLRLVLRSDPANVTQLDMLLGHYDDEYHAAVVSIATALASNSHVTHVTLRWSDADLLALFLAEMFGRQSAIVEVTCVDQSPTVVDAASATALNDLRKAGERMASVNTLSFSNCRNAALVSGLLRHLPLTLHELRLAGSAIDVVGTRELARHLEESSELRLLDLDSASLRSADFLHVTGALRRAKSLTHLVLSRTSLDAICLTSLAEAMTLNTSLRQLDVRGVDMDSAGDQTTYGSLCRVCRESDDRVVSPRRRPLPDNIGGHRVKLIGNDFTDTVCFTKPVADYFWM